MKQIFALLFLFATSFCTAQVSDSEMTGLVESWLASHDNPAVVGCVVKGGGILWMDAFGKAQVADGYDATVYTPFMLASVSKTYTATALLKLISEGLVNLTDPVNDHLPFEVVNPNFPNTTITVEQLLTHTSGIADNWDVMPYCDGDCTTPLADFMMGYFTPGELEYDANANFHNWEPGTTYSYSNIGATLIGYLVESISGTNFSDYCEGEIFAPMCMPDTHWFLAGFNDVSVIATPYDTYVNPPEAVAHYGYPDYPDGQLRTTITDMAKWLTMNLNNGFSEFAGQVLPETVANEAMSVQFGSDQGHIWYSFYMDGDVVWGHNGGDLGVSSDILISKENDLAIALISNGDDDLSTILEDTYVWAKSANIPPNGLVPPSCLLAVDEGFENSLRVFPNPCTKSFVVEANSTLGATHVDVLNVTGQLLSSRQLFSSPITINTQDWEGGLYFVEVVGPTGKQVVKLVVE